MICAKLRPGATIMDFEVNPINAAVAHAHGITNPAVANSLLSRSLVILGCSARKKQTSRLLPAIDRYDGPTFQVLRKHLRATPGRSPDACILSGRFGLIPGGFLIPRYERQARDEDCVQLGPRVDSQLKEILDDVQPERLFVSVGGRYWRLIENTLLREVPASGLVVAVGGIGGRGSQLLHWLRLDCSGRPDEALSEQPRGEAVLLGTTVRQSREEVLQKACKWLSTARADAARFETWYVPVGRERVAPKWLVSILFDKPVARFRTADAKRVLAQLGVEVKYAD